MSVRYAIAESPHRWMILAGIAFAAAVIGTIFIFAFEWPHALARLWLYAGLVLTLVFVGLALRDWKRRAEVFIREHEPANGVQSGNEAP